MKNKILVESEEALKSIYSMPTSDRLEVMNKVGLLLNAAHTIIGNLAMNFRDIQLVDAISKTAKEKLAMLESVEHITAADRELHLAWKLMARLVLSKAPETDSQEPDKRLVQ